MANIDVGTTTSGRREVNREINMIPFIDFLLVTVAFLLITAVWVTFSRVDATAQVPGPPDGEVPFQPEKVLHVHANENEFALIWKHGATTISETRVRRDADFKGEPRYPALAKAVAEEWKTHGVHRDPADGKPDLAVLHTHDGAPFRELVAAIDAVYETQRDRVLPSGERRKMAAFAVSFAAR